MDETAIGVLEPQAGLDDGEAGDSYIQNPEFRDTPESEAGYKPGVENRTENLNPHERAMQGILDRFPSFKQEDIRLHLEGTAGHIKNNDWIDEHGVSGNERIENDLAAGNLTQEKADQYSRTLNVWDESSDHIEIAGYFDAEGRLHASASWLGEESAAGREVHFIDVICEKRIVEFLDTNSIVSPDVAEPAATAQPPIENGNIFSEPRVDLKVIDMNEALRAQRDEQTDLSVPTDVRNMHLIPIIRETVRIPEVPVERVSVVMKKAESAAQTPPLTDAPTEEAVSVAKTVPEIMQRREVAEIREEEAEVPAVIPESRIAGSEIISARTEVIDPVVKETEADRDVGIRREVSAVPNPEADQKQEMENPDTLPIQDAEPAIQHETSEESETELETDGRAEPVEEIELQGSEEPVVRIPKTPERESLQKIEKKDDNPPRTAETAKKNSEERKVPVRTERAESETAVVKKQKPEAKATGEILPKNTEASREERVREEKGTPEKPFAEGAAEKHTIEIFPHPIFDIKPETSPSAGKAPHLDGRELIWRAWGFPARPRIISNERISGGNATTVSAKAASHASVASTHFKAAEDRASGIRLFRPITHRIQLKKAA